MRNESIDDKRPLASIPLQTLIYFDFVFSVPNIIQIKHIYFVLQLLIFIYKGYGLYYASNLLSLDIFILVLSAFIQYPRLELGSIGNKTESPNQIMWLLLLCFPMAFFFFYFMLLQTYVLLAELVINIIGLIFLAFEIAFSVFAFLSFKNYEKTQ
ncbi:hypothetical protein pb186bvf_001536 [Paramecium bursaria]